MKRERRSKLLASGEVGWCGRLSIGNEIDQIKEDNLIVGRENEMQI